MIVKELIDVLKKYPADKEVKIMGWYTMVEYDIPEKISYVGYLEEVDEDMELTGEKVTDYVSIITNKYHELVEELF